MGTPFLKFDPGLLKRALTPAERAENFQMNTRLWRQTQPTITKSPGEKFQIKIDKVNLFAKARLLVEQTINAKHAAAVTYTPALMAPYSGLEQVKVSSNLAYTPWDVSGIGAYLLMLFRPNPHVLSPVFGAATPTDADKRRWAYMGNVSSAAGTDNKIRYEIDLPISINDRDPQGLILTQNEKTNIMVEGKLAELADLAPAAAGYTFSLGDATITPVIESYTVPPIEEAIPDLSVIKTVQEANDSTIAGKYTFKLPTGPTYRRIVFMLTKADGTPVDDDDLTGDLELKLQTNDSPIVIPGKMLQRIYQEQTGHILPRGVWGLDFTYQGLINYGGMRDLLDTDGSTEVWLQIRDSAVRNLKVVYEGLDVMG